MYNDASLIFLIVHTVYSTRSGLLFYFNGHSDGIRGNAPHDRAEKGGREEMVTDVAGVERQFSVVVPSLRRRWINLAVLHHLVDTVHLADDTHRLRRRRLQHHLVGDTPSTHTPGSRCIFRDTKSSVRVQ